MVFSPLPDYHDPNSNWQQHLQYQQQVLVENGSSSRRGPAGSDRPMSMAEQARIENIAPPAAVNCPRCGSVNTKFCYYNNRSLSQPRYWCRSCRRHWTHGGALRSIPSGGNRRGRRRRSSSAGPTATSAVTPPVTLGTEISYYDYYSINGFDDTVAPPPVVLPQFQIHELPSFDIGDVFSGLDDNIGNHEFPNPN